MTRAGTGHNRSQKGRKNGRWHRDTTHFPKGQLRSLEVVRTAVVMELRPESAPARLNLSVALLQLGDREAGRKELPEALRLDPRLTRVY
jgi:Flp pilus assembly protein TadD